MDDERIERRPFLRRENLCNCLRIKSVRSKSVNSFGGKSDHFTGPQQGAGLGHGFLNFVINYLENSGLRHAVLVADRESIGYPDFKSSACIA